MTAEIYTVGHSNRSLDDLVALLSPFGVTTLVDIRTVPRSRHNPQFNTDALGPALAPHGIAYVHLAALGGLRKPRKDSPNAGWRNESFRGYADYMQTDAFAQALDQLIAIAAKARAAIMCAEAVPWRCHRSLVADALLARGLHAAHVMSPTRANPHKLTPFARVEGPHVTYPGLPGVARLAPGPRRAEFPRRDGSSCATGGGRDSNPQDVSRRQADFRGRLVYRSPTSTGPRRDAAPPRRARAAILPSVQRPDARGP